MDVYIIDIVVNLDSERSVADALGEFEQLVLLAVLRLDSEAHAAKVRETIAEGADRRVTRGALYATLDRLTTKGFLDWEVEETTPARGGIPRRRFRVTKAGLASLRRSYNAFRTLSRGLEGVLREQ
jgi:DNA-binding PadR family transcriptional regulator